MTLRQSLGSLPPIETVSVDLPGQAATPVRIRRLTAGEVMALPKENHGLEIAAATILDDDGSPLFPDAAAVAAAPFVFTFPLIKAARQLNALDVDAAKGK
ncbi:MAG TPA: hypothetical protein VHQ47_17645 [Phycisphaerae bacterium]|jgi:hypothetical protein|nr:hypothetical protein [Phycisphaerae bacterium]HVZ27458.1 hypothetical protein [Rhizomicrobium sp.]